ncbi:MAG: ISAzo13 family transposase, partial [Planctomycetes bacterium]|nr:ISAzo13 family transposase [Planctomycetota bacterium]
VNFVSNTKTDTGLRIQAYIDEREYAKGIKVSNKEFKRLRITKNDELDNWNYTIKPTCPSTNRVVN